MSITYTISKENKVDKIGEIDQEIFKPEFQKDTLSTFLQDHPNFIKWSDMLYNSGISKKPEYKFAGAFGTWLIYKIGEKGVSKTIQLANIFESHYKDEAVESVVGFNALVEFLQQDWDNEEKQYIETNSVRRIIEKSVKKIRKIIRESHKKDKIPDLLKPKKNKESA